MQYEYLPVAQQLEMLREAIQRLEMRHMQERMRAEVTPEDTSYPITLERITEQIESLKAEYAELEASDGE